MATHWSKRHSVVPAVYLLIERDGKMLLMRRANTGYLDGYYTAPSGHLDGGESPSTATAREAKEEVGVSVKPEDLEMVHCVVYRSKERDHERVSLFFKASKFMGEPKNMEPHKCDEIMWADPKNMPENLVWEFRHAMDEIAKGRIYSETNY